VGDAAVSEGIGLSNTRARLLHLYGPSATVELSSVDAATRSSGARVEICIPFRAVQAVPPAVASPDARVA
jgi:sensor histidine kinase YesM